MYGTFLSAVVMKVEEVTRIRGRRTEGERKK
jgi:hypothetical protein